MTRLIAWLICTGLVPIGLMLTASIAPGQESTEKSKKDALIGKWIVDLDETVKIADDPQFAEQIREAKKNDLKVEMEIKTDGKMVSNLSGRGQSRTKKGDWKLQDQDESSVTLVVVEADNNVTEEITFTFLDDDTIRMAKKGEPRELAFRRVKETKEK